MIYIYIFSSILILLLLVLAAGKVMKLRVTWNEHKNKVFEMDKKLDRLMRYLRYHDEKIEKKLDQNFKAIRRKHDSLENELNSIQYELLMDHLKEIIKKKKDKNRISSKALEELGKIINDRKMDNRVKDLLNKKKETG